MKIVSIKVACSLLFLSSLTVMASPLLAQQGAVVSAAAPVGLPRAVTQRIDAVVQTEMQRQGIPGMSVAVVKDGRYVWTQGYGLADTMKNAPDTTATVYPWASISKTLTAISVMQLVKQGKMDLDAPIQKYVPTFPVKSSPITIRELLGHLGGIRHYQGNEVFNTHHYATVTEGLSIFKNDPLVAEPGTAYHYSSYGYNLLGAAIEGASGMDYVTYVRRNILQPAGLAGIQLDDALKPLPAKVHEYGRINGILKEAPPTDNSYKLPSGDWCSTAGDLAQYGAAVLSGRLLDRGTLEQMWTAQKTRDGIPTQYGLGWELHTIAGQRVVAHTGGQPGLSTILFMLPERNVAVALMCNLNGAALPKLASQIATVLEAPDR
jgi:serine beta-lactamase-like protein LACTB